MLRACRILLLASLLALGLVPAASATPGSAGSVVDQLGVDLDVVRDAMARGARDAGAPPAEAAAYFADRPLQWFHPTESAVTQEQPDGTTFGARVLDLAEGGGQETVDGHLITRTDDGWWHYGTRDATGRILPGDALVGHDPAPAAAESWRMPTAFKENLARHQGYAEQLDAWFASRTRAQAAAAAEAGEPLVFKVPALMLAINNEPFQDSSTPESVQALYSGTGTNPTGTVTEMYLEQSFGQLVVQVDVYGVYSSAISMNPVNDCWYGTDGGPVLGDTLGLGGYGAKGLAAEAVPMADPDVDFSDYDMDGDGYVDFLMIVHSGKGAETTGDPCDVHSHRFGGLAPALVPGAPSEPTPVSADGVAIGQALTVPELDAGIGVVAHELMHAFGEPDYYGTEGTSGTGDWDLGGGGSYGGVPTQSSPLHFNPLMKVDFGWVQPRIVEDTTLDVELRPRASHPDLVLVPTRRVPEGADGHDACAKDPLNTGQVQTANFLADNGDCLVEGYLLEFLSPTSASWDREQCTFTPADFDRQMYGTGLAVWHYDLSSYEQLGNDNRLRPMLDLEEFDRRDGAQELEQNITRAQPLDLFWGDPVGISSATADTGGASSEIAPPDGSPYTVTAPPGTAATTEAWTAPADTPDGALMEVTLSWTTQDVDDWDLAVQKKVGDTWQEVATTGSLPGSGAEVAQVAVEPGAQYRGEAVNYASASTTADVTVAYVHDASIATKFGPANTISADNAPTGWSFTNIRPFDYAGMAHAAQAPDATVTLDLVHHDDTTVDVSGDFLAPVTDDEAAQPIVAGEPVTLRSHVYNHGGQPVTARFDVYDEDPSSGSDPIATFRRDLGAYARDAIELDVTPAAGRHSYWVVANAPGDLVAGNDVVRSELVANPAADARVLVVDNDLGWTQEQTVQASLLALGVPHDVVTGEPDADTLADYDAAIWLTSGVSGAAGVLSPDGWDAITSYLDGGGRVWLASNRAVGYASDPGVARTTQLAEYFGVVGDNNILDPLGDVMTGQGDAIGGSRDVLMSYIDGRPYVDYFHLASEAADAPAAPRGDVTGLFVHEQRPDAFVGARLDADGFQTVVTPAPTGIARGADQVALAADVMTAFGIATPGPDRADTRVAHNRFQHVQTGKPWEVTVGAPSADATAFVYRVHGDDDWTRMALDESVDGLWTGTIPAADVTNNGLDYYVQVVTRGRTRDVDGGARLPDVASGTYGDPADVDFGVCAAQVDAPGRGRGRGVPPAAPAAPPARAPLPTTGGGLALAGLAGLAGAASLRRRTVTRREPSARGS